MPICAAWLLKHAALFSIHAPSLEAIGFYERAVQLDPNFALAWARLSRASVADVNRTAITALVAMRRNVLGECAKTGTELA